MAARLKVRSRSADPDLIARAERLLDREISFIYSRSFEQLSEQHVALPAAQQLFRRDAGSPPGSSGVGDLLTAEGEAALFRRMNFLKFQASRLRARLSRRRPSRAAVERMERLLAEAAEARAIIAEANLRLVAKLARKLGRGDCFDDFRSEGHAILLYSIDMFDVDRGFRFSTYATHAVQRHLYRQLQRRSRRLQRETSTPADVLADSVPAADVDEGLPEVDPQLARRMLAMMHEHLEPRELSILRSRFGLGGGPGQPLRAVAHQLGLSKERVRQLQNRALEKLRVLLAPLGGQSLALG
ncbi:MAG: sigma-70 family RNA polymerase sigma factor [Planctomyces sp.]|nr:sigma-70 family RNA polymerase sigma factor [Planctomyces sp.]